MSPILTRLLLINSLTVPSQSKPEQEAANLTSTTLVNPVAARSLSGPGTSPDDYYQTVAINALLSILRDQSQTGQHHKVIEAIMSTFKTQGLKCVAFLPQVSRDPIRCWIELNGSMQQDHTGLHRSCPDLSCSNSSLPSRTACYPRRDHKAARSESHVRDLQVSHRSVG